MIKKLLTAFVAAFLFVTPTYAGMCPGGMQTEKEFFSYTEDAKFEVYTLTAEGLDKFKTVVNAIREKNGATPFTKTAKFYFAKIDEMNTGVVWMDAGCVVPDTVITVPSAAMANVLYKAGIKAEEMVKFVYGTPA